MNEKNYYLPKRSLLEIDDLAQQDLNINNLLQVDFLFWSSQSSYTRKANSHSNLVYSP